MPTNKPLLLGLAVFAAALALFLLLATLVAPHPPMALDRGITDAMYREASDSPNARAALVVVTDLGDKLVLAVMASSVAVVLLCWRQWVLAAVWLAVVVGGAGLNLELKDQIQRARPEHAGEFTSARHTSFPSGHSMNSLIDYGMLAYLLTLALNTRWIRVSVVSLLALLVLGIGFSRIYLNAHWFTDVVGGFAAGAAYLVLCVTVVEIARRRRSAIPVPADPPLEVEKV